MSVLLSRALPGCRLMKVLLISDLHFRWFDWVRAQAPQFDLVAIAGDLLDGDAKIPEIEQIAGAKDLITELTSQTQVAICSGNHDCEAEVFNGKSPFCLWMSELKTAGLVTDGRSRLVGAGNDRLVVTALHFDVLAGFSQCQTVVTARRNQKLLLQGKAVREKLQIPWLILHHSPVASGGRPTYAEVNAGKMIRDFSPDYLFSGHNHDFPYRFAGAWSAQYSKTRFFCAGQCLGASSPNHIVLDTSQSRAQWSHTKDGQVCFEEIFCG